MRYIARTDRADQNEVPWNELTHDAEPEGCQTVQNQYHGTSLFQRRHVLFPANRQLTALRVVTYLNSNSIQQSILQFKSGAHK